jgi:hypothetical protein
MDLVKRPACTALKESHSARQTITAVSQEDGYERPGNGIPRGSCTTLSFYCGVDIKAHGTLESSSHRSIYRRPVVVRLTLVPRDAGELTSHDVEICVAGGGRAKVIRSGSF